MKKTIVFMVILSLVSIANAAIVLTPSSTLVNPGDTITMTIQANAGEQIATIDVGIIRDGGAGGLAIVGTLNALFVTADNGYRGDVLGLGDTQGDIGYISGQVNLPDYATGPLYTYSYQVSAAALAGSVINFTLPDTAGDPYYFASGVTLAGSTDKIAIEGASITVAGIPEPMTMVLLGLGGLWLRKRSK